MTTWMMRMTATERRLPIVVRRKVKPLLKLLQRAPPFRNNEETS
jgi:hypothetical protein